MIINNIVATTVDIVDPAFDMFLTEAAVNEFKTNQISSSVMQLLGLFLGNRIYN